MKKLISLFPVLIALILSISVTSCSKDNDDDEPESKSEIIGTWLWSDDVEPSRYTFKDNGTFIEEIWSADDPDEIYVDRGKYKYDPVSDILQLNYSDTETEIFIVTIIGDRMVWNDAEDGGHVATLYRQ